MRDYSRWPGTLKLHLVEVQARRFRDPIEKLAYLRKVADAGFHCCPARPIQRIPRQWTMTLLFLIFLGIRMQTISDASVGPPSPSGTRLAVVHEPHRSLPTAVWPVEKGPDYETYSNGLRIENRFLASNVTRNYVVFQHAPAQGSSRGYADPAGIVLHTTESLQVPFEAGHNTSLRQIGRELLDYTRRHRSYHFVIDRFGRVFRIVPETDVADHAGKSVWADAHGVYVSLNRSFLGIAFEAQTREIDDGTYLSPAQTDSGRLLIQMLVGKYNIPLTNCVTHAQVSVNPDNMRIGYHTDGSGDFPFQQLGLPDNYSLPVASLFVFGFNYDPTFLKVSGSRLWKGLLAADERLRQEALSHGLSVGQYRRTLQERYRTIAATFNTKGALEEKEDEIK